MQFTPIAGSEVSYWDQMLNCYLTTLKEPEEMSQIEMATAAHILHSFQELWKLSDDGYYLMREVIERCGV